MGQTQFRSDDTVKWWLGFGNGSDGDYSSAGNATDAPIDSSCSGTASSTSLSATNASFASGKPILIHQTRGTGAGNWELNQIDSYTSGTITLKKPLQNTYTDSGASQAQVIQLKQYNNFTQNSGHTLTAKAWDGNVGGIIAFLAKGTVTITGTLSAIGKGFLGATGGNNTNSSGRQGEGSVAARDSVSRNANGNGGGGGVLGSYDRSGGGAGGGYTAAGSDGSVAGGVADAYGGFGGNLVGAAALTSLFPGGGGGEGANGDAGTSGAGGTGGGVVLIICNTITVTGAITTSGNAGSNSSGAYAGGGGGGAGGSILIKAKTAILGSTLATASAGAGSTGTGGSSPFGNGGAGAVGRIHLDYSSSYTGTTSPTLDYTLDPTIKAPGGSNFFLVL